jgi:aerobic-type carbon monoxide dehydrogenase small subunit (CoxS/CutS family)
MMKKTKPIEINLNGQERTFEVFPGESLLDLLRRSGLIGTKHGCDDGACGACTVLLDGRSVNACITFAFQAHGRTVWTVEGIGEYDHPHPFQKILAESGGVPVS